MYLYGDAPLPHEYAFMPLDGLRGSCRPTPPSACCSPSTARTRRGSARTGDRRAGAADDRTSTTTTTTRRFGDVNLIVADASSTGEVLRDLFAELGVELTPEIAEPLYIALVTDTGRFQYTNTTPKALRLAADLVEAGADVHRVFQGVYESVEFAKLKLLARALERAEIYDGGRLVVSHLLRSDFTEVGAAEAYAEGIIDYLRAVDGADMAALIREPPRTDGPARSVSLRAQTDELDVSAIARKSGGGGHRQAAGFSSDASIDEITRLHPRASSLVPPRALSPSGLVLIDKPAGPSSFAVVARLRRRTGARAGHAGTLDPFATGLLLVLSGAATKLAQRFVGLDKRYVTDVDLSRAHHDRRPRGRARRRAEPPREGSSSGCVDGPARRDRAAGPGVLGGEDRRRARLPAAPPRRGGRDAGAALARGRARPRLYEDGVARLDLRVSSGTYVRAIAEALGGHCATLRRTEVGPFRVEEADEERIVPPDEALARIDPRGRVVTVARTPGELERRPRAVAIGTFDGVHLGHRRVIQAAGRRGPRADGRHVRPAPARCARQRRRAADDAGAAAGADRRGGDRGGARGRVRPGVLAAGARGVRGAACCGRSAPRSCVAGDNFRFGHERARRPRPLRGLGFDARAVPLVEGVSSCTDPRSPARRRDRARRRAARPAARGRRDSSCPATRAAARSGSRPRTCGRPAAARPRVRHLRGRRGRPPGGDLDRHQPALRRRRAAHRGVPARLRGRPLRASGSSSSSGGACATRRSSRARRSWSSRSPATSSRRARPSRPA